MIHRVSNDSLNGMLHNNIISPLWCQFIHCGSEIGSPSYFRFVSSYSCHGGQFLHCFPENLEPFHISDFDIAFLFIWLFENVKLFHCLSYLYLHPTVQFYSYLLLGV